MGFFRRNSSSSDKPDRLFFVTDVHGSDRCFRKFLNAGKVYGAKHLILGGDITGKAIVPIEQTPRGYKARFLDREYVDMTEAERQELENLIRDNGAYPLVAERDEIEALADEGHRDTVFVEAVVGAMDRWVDLADERLRGTGIRCYITPGNDDFWEIDAPLQRGESVEFVEGRCVRLDDHHEMITTGYSNITPWQSPRELEEPELEERIDRMFAEVTDPENLVAVLHAPPYGSMLDQAPVIDSEFRVQTDGGSTRMGPVGSTAVREFIERRQPLLGLHGHVHESKAAEEIGRTLCLNPGSEYSLGSLCGALVTLSEDRVVAHQFTVG
jgi:Icc-related predicted phosphoesterase